MAILRTDIERALDELASQEEGMRFQGLAVVLGKKRWPELIARQRKKDSGLDAYAPANLTPEKIGKGLAASITPTLKKVSADAKTAKESFPDLKMLLFVTSAKVGNADRKQWEEAIHKDHGLELHIIEREEIITLMMMPENASLCASFLNLEIDAEPQIVDLIERTRRAANAVAQTWARKTKGHPLIDLTAVRLDPNGAESADVLSLEHIDQALSQSGRIVLEGPAGRGKTTTLIQLAQRTRSAGTPFIVELPAWTSSCRGILEYIAGMPAFQVEGLTAADLARVQQTEPFLLLLNGWNEIAESNSERANHALRELERDFPSAGIIVATRTHHLKPPLPGALRLRLMPLQRVQRAAYLAARLGARGAELRERIDADPSLDELTRTPFVLSEVASLFEARARIPSTKLGVLAEVLRLQELRDEHRNALQAAPIFGLPTEYLKSLAIDMTRRGAVALPEADARAFVAAATRELAGRGQTEPVGAPAVLATLTAHHVLERFDYPQTAFQFEHQQLQEYYAAIDARARLLDLRDDDRDAIGRFTADYVNDPTWAEPLRMIAGAFAEQTGDGETDKRNTSAGGKLVAMALTVDLVFAGELAQLCGAAVWSEVRAVVAERFRAIYAIRDGNFRPYALAAMLATGAGDFSDIIVPLLSGQDQQTRLRTYRLWPDMHVSSLGPNWREQVRGWSEEARTDFVSELLHHRVDGEAADFAVEDNSISVKKAAVSGLMWTGSENALTCVLESMDAETFDDVARKNAARMPAALRPKTIAAMRKFIESTTDHPARLQTALDLIELEETGLDGVVKDAMAALPGGDRRNLDSHYNMQPALEYLRKTDPAWASEWVATQVAEGVLDGHEYWLPFATAIPDDLVEKYLRRLETEDLKNAHFEGMIAVVAARADAKLAARVFSELRELRRKVDAEPGQRHEFEWQVMRQLEAMFRRLPDDAAAGGILSSVTSGDPRDIKVAANLLGRAARSDVEPLRIADENLKARLRAYLTSSVDLILRQDDFNGEKKANLASSIAQVGKPEDMAHLVTLIRADIERIRRGRAARAAGDGGPLGNGAIISYANWHVRAVVGLDPATADTVLLEVLKDPEYEREAAGALVELARTQVVDINKPFGSKKDFASIWDARAGKLAGIFDEARRERYAMAIRDQIAAIMDNSVTEGPTAPRDRRAKDLAVPLATIDGRDSVDLVLEVASLPGDWDAWTRVDALEKLLFSGASLPAEETLQVVDSVFTQIRSHHHDHQERYLVQRILCILPFVEPPSKGFDAMRQLIAGCAIQGYELCEVVAAVGCSSCDRALEFLREILASGQRTEQVWEACINATAAIDDRESRELLLSFVDRDDPGLSVREGDVLAHEIAELAQRDITTRRRILELCSQQPPPARRELLARIISRLDSEEAVLAGLSLIHDQAAPPVPRPIWRQLENVFVERRPYRGSPNTFTLAPRSANEIRTRLFEMASSDERRKRAAFGLLGQIELWRLEHGRPASEPRHPALASRLAWPIMHTEV